MKQFLKHVACAAGSGVFVMLVAISFANPVRADNAPAVDLSRIYFSVDLAERIEKSDSFSVDVKALVREEYRIIATQFKALNDPMDSAVAAAKKKEDEIVALESAVKLRNEAHARENHEFDERTQQREADAYNARAQRIRDDWSALQSRRTRELEPLKRQRESRRAAMRSWLIGPSVTRFNQVAQGLIAGRIRFINGLSWDQLQLALRNANVMFDSQGKIVAQVMPVAPAAPVVAVPARTASAAEAERDRARDELKRLRFAAGTSPAALAEAEEKYKRAEAAFQNELATRAYRDALSNNSSVRLLTDREAEAVYQNELVKSNVRPLTYDDMMDILFLPDPQTHNNVFPVNPGRRLINPLSEPDRYQRYLESEKERLISAVRAGDRASDIRTLANNPATAAAYMAIEQSLSHEAELTQKRILDIACEDLHNQFELLAKKRGYSEWLDMTTAARSNNELNEEMDAIRNKVFSATDWLLAQARRNAQEKFNADIDRLMSPGSDR